MRVDLDYSEANQLPFNISFSTEKELQYILTLVNQKINNFQNKSNIKKVSMSLKPICKDNPNLKFLEILVNSNLDKEQDFHLNNILGMQVFKDILTNFNEINNRNTLKQLRELSNYHFTTINIPEDQYDKITDYLCEYEDDSWDRLYFQLFFEYEYFKEHGFVFKISILPAVYTLTK
ncbi:MAG: hypothetical protein [Bacteriophage sp.]|nr:MAG: hypothetical protein [Bacteriophage sp.]